MIADTSLGKAFTIIITMIIIVVISLLVQLAIYVITSPFALFYGLLMFFASTPNGVEIKTA